MVSRIKIIRMTHDSCRRTIMATIIFVLFAMLGAPLFAMFGGIALFSYDQAGLSSIAIISEYYKLASQPVLLTIPLFTFAGYLLAESKAPTRLVNVAKAFLGWMPGGLAIVTICSCAFFTAFTGASGVTIIALGGLMYPILMKDGYGDKFSMGLVTCCGSLGLLFPPSLPIILYGMIGNLPIDRLFVAGILPGAVLMVVLTLYSSLAAVKLQPQYGQKIDFRNLGRILFSYTLAFVGMGAAIGLCFGIYKLLLMFIPGMTMPKLLALFLVLFVVGVFIASRFIPNNAQVKALREAIWELPLPVVIVVCIYGGFITVSEAAAVTAFYVLIVEIFIYRDIKIFSDVPRIIRESMILVGGILIILGVAMGMTNYFIDQEVPTKIFTWVSQYITNKYLFLVALNLFLLVVGCLMDIFSAIIVVVPIITPIALKYGIDPVHLAFVFLTNLEIGYLTPPVGLNLFISSFRFKRSVLDVARVSFPFLLLLIVALMIITYIPWLSSYLVQLTGI